MNRWAKQCEQTFVRSRRLWGDLMAVLQRVWTEYFHQQRSSGVLRRIKSTRVLPTPPGPHRQTLQAARPARVDAGLDPHASFRGSRDRDAPHSRRQLDSISQNRMILFSRSLRVLA